MYEIKCDRWIFMTQLKPAAARRLFPCWDELSLKARFFIAIKHHRNYTALSNTPVWEQWRPYDDMLVTQFYITPPMSTYLVAFSLTYLTCDNRKGNGFTTRVCCKSSIMKEMTYALDTSAGVASFMKRYIGISPQLSEITSIDLSDFTDEAAGN